MLTNPRSAKAARKALAADMPPQAARDASTMRGASLLLREIDDGVIAGHVIEFASACAQARLTRVYLRSAP